MLFPKVPAILLLCSLCVLGQAGNFATDGVNPGPRPTTYERVCVGQAGSLVNPDYGSGTQYLVHGLNAAEFPADVRLFEDGACRILATLGELYTKPAVVARLVPTLDKEHAASAAFLRRFGAVLLFLKNDQIESYKLVDDAEFKSMSDGSSLSNMLKNVTYLSCYAPSEIVDGTRIDCEVTDASAKPLSIVSWTIPSAKSKTENRDDRKAKKELHPVDLLRLGSDKIEIAWRLGRAWIGLSGPSDGGESVLESFKDDVESETFQREMKEDCPSLTADNLKKTWLQYGSDISAMADQSVMMRASMSYAEVDALIKALFGTVDLTQSSINALEAPREVVDGFRLGMLSASFELYGAKTCAQQHLMKSLASRCAPFVKRMKVGIVQYDNDWATSLESLLATYGVQFKLPAVDCSPSSQQSFLRYVEQVKLSGWSALRSRGSQKQGDQKQ